MSQDGLRFVAVPAVAQEYPERPDAVALAAPDSIEARGAAPVAPAVEPVGDTV